jgi:hypothetical protein
MRAKITRQARQFVLTGERADLGDLRRYYVAQQSTARLMIIACRNGLELNDLVGMTVDASLGWDDGTRGFVHEQNVGAPHSKLTIYRVSSRRHDKTLARILNDAPHSALHGQRKNNDHQ